MFNEEKLWKNAIESVMKNKDYKKMKPSNYFKLTVEYVETNLYKNINKDYQYYKDFMNVIN